MPPLTDNERKPTLCFVPGLFTSIVGLKAELMINHGKIVLSAPLETIRETHRIDGRVPSLDEIFVTRVGRSATTAADG